MGIASSSHVNEVCRREHQNTCGRCAERLVLHKWYWANMMLVVRMANGLQGESKARNEENEAHPRHKQKEQCSKKYRKKEKRKKERKKKIRKKERKRKKKKRKITCACM